MVRRQHGIHICKCHSDCIRHTSYTICRTVMKCLRNALCLTNKEKCLRIRNKQSTLNEYYILFSEFCIYLFFSIPSDTFFFYVDAVLSQSYDCNTYSRMPWQQQYNLLEEIHTIGIKLSSECCYAASGKFVHSSTVPKVNALHDFM